MTEQEFFKQIWRPYDKVVLTSGITGNVVAVSFPTRSVKVSIDRNIVEWYKCDLIEQHISKGDASDEAIIMKLNNTIEELQDEIVKKNEMIYELQIKSTSAPVKELKKSINQLMNAHQHLSSFLQKTEEVIIRAEAACEKVESICDDNEEN